MFSDSVNSRLKVRKGPAGLHFFNRTTGINVLVDEIIPLLISELFDLQFSDYFEQSV